MTSHRERDVDDFERGMKVGIELADVRRMQRRVEQKLDVIAN